MTDSRPKFLVVGLGGIGGVVAGHLLEDGHDVTAVVSNPNVRSALSRGLKLTAGGRTRIVRSPQVVQTPDAGAIYDFILLATQPPQVEAAAASVAPFLAADGAMVVFQNGLCEERIARIVGVDRVVGGIVAWGASMPAPGEAVQTSSGGFTIGTLKGADDRCRRLADLLRVVGPSEVTENLAGARWTKLAFNCAVSSLGTIGGDRLGPLIRHSFVRRLGLETMTEVVDVARAEGITLENLAGTLRIEWLALTRAERAGRGGVRLLGKHTILFAVGQKYRKLRSSMLAAIERGRPPAVDFLNGEIVERAERHGLSVPVNRALQTTVHAIARGERRSELSTLRSIYETTRFR